MLDKFITVMFPKVKWISNSYVIGHHMDQYSTYNFTFKLIYFKRYIFD